MAGSTPVVGSTGPRERAPDVTNLVFMAYEVCTPVFAGDLELLAQLVSRRELDVVEVALGAIVEGYLAESETGGTLDLEEATRFLVALATLIELKTRLLLSSDDQGEEEEPPPVDRDILLTRMLQGLTFHKAGAALATLISAAERCVPRRVGPGVSLASVERDPLESIAPHELLGSLWRALAPQPTIDLYYVTPVRASVSDAIEVVVRALSRCEQLSFFDLTGDDPGRLEVIVRFLAVLELCKRGKVELEQAGAFGELVVRYRADGDEEAAEAVVEAGEGI